MCTKPWAMRTMNRLLVSLEWYWANWRSVAANLALLVPAPIRPKAKMELCATSASVSWLNLVRVSRIFSWGLETEIRPKARGTARRMAGSQYRRRWPKCRNSISPPISSPIAMSAKPMTATACWDDKSGFSFSVFFSVSAADFLLLSLASDFPPFLSFFSVSFSVFSGSKCSLQMWRRLWIFKTLPVPA